MGFCYLLHFDKPIGNLTHPKGKAQHYLGYTSTSLRKRLLQHKTGQGAKITRAVVRDYCYGLQLVRHWSNCTRDMERDLKKKHNPASFCPVCNPQTDKTS